jgi:hypothetical protein
MLAGCTAARVRLMPTAGSGRPTTRPLAAVAGAVIGEGRRAIRFIPADGAARFPGAVRIDDDGDFSPGVCGTCDKTSS